MRTIALLLALTLSACGFRGEDPELEAAAAWTRAFKTDQPAAAREVGKLCKAQQELSAFTRDGAMELFTCIRLKAEAKGFYYE